MLYQALNSAYTTWAVSWKIWYLPTYLVPDYFVSIGTHRINARDTGSVANHHIDAKVTDVRAASTTSTASTPFEIHWPKLVTGSYGNMSLDFRVRLISGYTRNFESKLKNEFLVTKDYFNLNFTTLTWINYTVISLLVHCVLISSFILFSYPVLWPRLKGELLGLRDRGLGERKHVCPALQTLFRQDNQHHVSGQRSSEGCHLFVRKYGLQMPTDRK